MSPNAVSVAEVESYIDAFEAVRSSDASARISDYVPPTRHPAFEEVATELIRADLEFAWRDGNRISFESYRGQFPQIVDHPRRRSELAFEEYRLRWRENNRIDRNEFASRFGVDSDTWPALTEDDTTWVPTIGGDEIFDLDIQVPGFEIVEELGKGAVGRVYLARQIDLAGRPVVLKCTQFLRKEADRIARLQHTNIVPIHSAHEMEHPNDSRRTLNIICMPYFGRTTLADVIRKNDAVDDQFVGVALRQEAPCLQVVEQLASGLTHAHHRGIWHQDIKPANVLLADHGQAMLLDFNLAKEETRHTSISAGGTLAYMSPEQIRGLNERARIGPWSDVYSLGVVLYQMLTGSVPFPVSGKQGTNAALVARETPPSVREANPSVSPSVASIVRRCLASNIVDRYQSAAELKDDIQRHQAHFPLLHASNDSWSERGRKWIKRHPRLTSMSSVAMVAAVCMAIISTAAIWQQEKIKRLTGRQQVASLQASVERARAPLTVPGTPAELVATASNDLLETIAEMGLNIKQEEFRVEDWPPLDSVEDKTRNTYGAALGDALYLISNSRSRQTEGSADSDAQRIHRLAEAAYAISPDAAIGLTEAGERMQTGDYMAATKLLLAAKQDQPVDASLHLLLGNCRFAMGDLNQSMLDFTAAASLWPDSHVPLLYRGLVRMEGGDLTGAHADLDNALEIRPSSRSARFNRAQVFVRQKDWNHAIEDLDQLVKERPTIKILLLRAKVHNRMGNASQAESDRQLAKTLKPEDDDDAIALALMQLPAEPDKCRADLDAIVSRNPASTRALQNLAHVCGEHLGSVDDAIDYLDRMVAIRIHDLTAIAGRGVLQARQGQIAAALADAKTVEEITGGNTMDALHAYQLACLYSLCMTVDESQQSKALAYLARAIRTDGKWLPIAQTDPDLENLQNKTEFDQLIAAAARIGHN